ncbi:MAG TPA: hypothetical protein VGO40_23930 [Longimicrobium sp.]|jgi:hypothetical protein|nr:hypothetical protein [Longimicrobium sp.]
MALRALPFLLVAVAAAASSAAAQRRAADASPARLETAAPLAQAAPAPALPAEGRSSRHAASARRAVVSVLGGALIGAGAGFLTSQVAWSDWDKRSNSEFKSRRLSFTLGGSALGAVTGLVLGRHVSGPAALPVAAPVARTVSRTSVITEEEVRASTAETVYQMVQAIRPMWLRREGVTGHTNPPDPDVEAPPAPITVADDPGVRVYVERGLVGDIYALRQIAVTEVTSLEFLDTAAATYRLGPGNPSGAIVVHTGRVR